MWKKLGIVALAWLGTLSAVYGYGYYMKHLHAASNLNYGGNVSGRVHTAPTNLSGPKDTIGMKKGDRVYLGSHDGTAIGWQLITDQIVAGNVVEDSWLAMINLPIGTVA